MTIEGQIEKLYREEKSRNFDKQIPGFYYTQSQYEGTPIYDEV